MIKNKRVKSFFINLGSYIGTALLALVASPLFPQLVDFISRNVNNQAAKWGIPAIFVAVVSFIVSEVWKKILNNRIIAENNGKLAGGIDLY